MAAHISGSSHVHAERILQDAHAQERPKITKAMESRDIQLATIFLDIGTLFPKALFQSCRPAHHARNLSRLPETGERILLDVPSQELQIPQSRSCSHKLDPKVDSIYVLGAPALE